MVASHEIFKIGVWRIDALANQISAGSELMHLRPQLMELLVYLAEQHGRVATLEEIHDNLWRGKVVSSGTIYNCIAELRQAFAQFDPQTTYIETIPKKGYRLAVKVSEALSEALPSPEITIAILPMVNRSNDPDNVHLCEGIAEELIFALVNVTGLKVASQLASFAFRNQNVDVRVMGTKLKVDYLLSGSVQKADDRVRISVLLSNVKDGSSLWSHRYDRELKDIFELQEDVARQVVDALKLELDPNPQAQLVDAGTRNTKAYKIFLMGLHEARKWGDHQSLEEAIVHFQRAAKIDPEYARVHWWLYFCYWRLIGVGLPRQEMEPKAAAALNRAEAAGFVPPVPWIKARRDLSPISRPDQRGLALEACDRIKRSDPEWRLFEYIQLGECLVAAGFNHGACEYYEYYLDRTHHDLSATWIHQRRWSLLSQVGRFEKAIELLSECIARGHSEHGWRAMLYSRAGQYNKAKQDIATLDERSFAKFYDLYWRREIDAAKSHLRNCTFETLLDQYWCWFLLGDFEKGIDYLEEDVRRGAHPAVFRSNIGEVLPASTLRKLDNHHRYQTILKQFGIDDAWCEELLIMVNDVTVVTGIFVRHDDDY